MKTTRLLALACVPLLLAPLAACGNGSDATEQPATTSPGPTAGATADRAPGGFVGDAANGRWFSDDSPWNQRIEGASLAADSARLIDMAQIRRGVEEHRGQPPVLTDRRITEGLYINSTAWAPPVVQGGQPTTLVCRQITCGDGDAEHDLTLNVPADIDPDPRYDGWFTIFDDAGEHAYDLWRARREDDSTISYHFMRRWDLRGPGYLPPRYASARGSGLPLFAGLIRPGELESGWIEHALAIGVPGPAPDRFVAPASATDGNGIPESVPLGARIRLRADVRWTRPVDAEGKLIPLTRQQQRWADAIVAALRTYGAIIVDRSAVPTLYGQRADTVPEGTRLRGNELQSLTLADFEVVELPRVQPYPPTEELAEQRMTDQQWSAWSARLAAGTDATPTEEAP